MRSGIFFYPFHLHSVALYLNEMVPKFIGRYKIKEELGRGDVTAVYRAFDTEANREVVVKVFALEPTGDTARDLSIKAHFRRELKMIASLEHPAIVPVYDVGEQDGNPYFVTRYMPNGSLNRVIASKGKLSLQETAEIIERIAPALDTAHKLNIIHRDIKPDNILFDFDMHPYISDFGVAKPDAAHALRRETDSRRDRTRHHNRVLRSPCGRPTAFSRTSPVSRPARRRPAAGSRSCCG